MHKLKQLLILTILAFPLMGKVALAGQVTDGVSNNNTSSSYLSLSVTSSSSSSSTGSDNPNLYLQAPEGGGIATGWHTLEASIINNGAAAKYSLTMASSSSSTDLRLKDTSSGETLASIPTSAGLVDKTWGYSLTANPSSEDILAIPDKNTPVSLVDGLMKYDDTKATITKNVYYAVRIENPASVLAGDYVASITYTLTTEVISPSTITSISPATVTIGDANESNNTIAIEGTNLSYTTSVYVDLDEDGKLDTSDSGSGNDSAVDETCTNITLDTDTPNAKLTCMAPNTSSIAAGTYTIRLNSTVGEASLDNAITYEEPVTIFSISTMQEMTSDICDATTTPSAFVTDDDGNTTTTIVGSSETSIDKTGEHQGDTNYVPETTLKDTRDGTEYTIRKLADGNCWMVENLALGTDNEAGLTLTSENTDLNSQESWTLPAMITGTTSTSDSTWASNTNDAHVIDHSSVSGWADGMGYLYTWGGSYGGK